MHKIIHYLGLDVHKNSIAVAIAVEGGRNCDPTAPSEMESRRNRVAVEMLWDT